MGITECTIFLWTSPVTRTDPYMPENGGCLAHRRLSAIFIYENVEDIERLALEELYNILGETKVLSISVTKQFYDGELLDSDVLICCEKLT